MQVLALVKNKATMSFLNLRLNQSWSVNKLLTGVFRKPIFGNDWVAFWRPKSNSIRINLFQTNKPNRQDPFRSNSDQSAKNNNSGPNPNKNDPRKSAILLVVSLALTALAYSTLNDALKKAQEEMQAKRASMMQNDVFIKHLKFLFNF